MVVTSNQMKELDPKRSNPLCGPSSPSTVETGCEMLTVAASAPQTTRIPTLPTRNACMFWKVGRSKHLNFTPNSQNILLKSSSADKSQKPVMGRCPGINRVALLPSALPRQRIELLFDESFYIEASFECRFDHIEVRDGPFSFSPLINRFCGSASPGLVLSSGRFMWIRFFSDEELEGIGFQVQYSFTAGDQKKYTVTMETPECSAL